VNEYFSIYLIIPAALEAEKIMFLEGRARPAGRACYGNSFALICTTSRTVADFRSGEVNEFFFHLPNPFGPTRSRKIMFLGSRAQQVHIACYGDSFTLICTISRKIADFRLDEVNEYFSI
jgi:fructose-1,6-bisphosphatase